jgi:hypothetical protein
MICILSVNQSNIRFILSRTVVVCSRSEISIYIFLYIKYSTLPRITVHTNYQANEMNWKWKCSHTLITLYCTIHYRDFCKIFTANFTKQSIPNFNEIFNTAEYLLPQTTKQTRWIENGSAPSRKLTFQN